MRIEDDLCIDSVVAMFFYPSIVRSEWARNPVATISDLAPHAVATSRMCLQRKFRNFLCGVPVCMLLSHMHVLGHDPIWHVPTVVDFR